jgi:DNA excision repair protein ERCC-4
LPELSIIADYREKSSNVPGLLESLGVKIFYRNLTVGDYVLSDVHAVERKAVGDFVSSLYLSRLFDQVLRLLEAYSEPIIIVEGDFQQALSWVKNPRALWGALASLTLKFEGKIRLFFTADKKQTAELLYALARQIYAKPRHVGPVVKQRRKVESLGEAQLLVLCSLPGVGPKLADRLLRKFKTVRRVFEASASELTLIEGLSPAKAKTITRILNTSYKPEAEKAKAKQDLLDAAEE